MRSCGPAWTIALHLLEMMYLDQAPAVNHGFHDLDQLEAKAVADVVDGPISRQHLK